MNKRVHLPLGLLIAALLSACGGGGDSTYTGRFVDGPVSGLRYSTPTHNGETNTKGEFTYETGETVSFYVGEILLGQAAGAATLTPFDLAGLTPPLSGSEIHQVVRRINNTNQVDALEVAANIAVFLQTLDEDGDPANGQQIPAAMHALATGTTINFKQEYRKFHSNIAFRKLVATGRAAGLWGGSRAIRDPLIALDSLYSGLGLMPAIEALISEETRTNVDGPADSRTTYTYDANGHLTLEEYEDNANADDAMIFYIAYAHDANSNLTLYELKTTGLSFSATTTYDANGYASFSKLDDKIDGAGDFCTIDSNNVYGNITSSAHDVNCDGTVDGHTTFTYDTNGNLTLQETDNGDDGVVDHRTTFAYDANGTVTLEEMDFNADGAVDNRTTYAYDINGNMTLRAEDSNGDGTVGYLRTYNYDTNGNKTLYELEFSGKLIYRVSYIYDISGNLKRTETDSDGDGTMNSLTTYTHNANGNLILAEYDKDANGTVDSFTSYTYINLNKWAAAGLFDSNTW